MSGDGPSTSSICGICEHNPSKYCCPRCEIFYCSLDCYKSQKHNHCSESFYRECVYEELVSYQTDDESRKKMFDILKRMNLSDVNDPSSLNDLLENIDNPDAHFSDSDDDENIDLHERIKDLNLDDPDVLWDALTEDEKNEFEAALNQGDVGSFIPVWEPWWMYNDEDIPVQELDKAKKEEELALKRCPTLKTVPKLDCLTKVQPSPAIKFNLTNVIAAYTFITRYFNGEFDPVETCACLLNVCANLDANANFDDPEVALESVAQRCLQSDLIQTDEASLDVMTKDTFLIIQGPSKGNQTHYCKAALSHLHKLFSDARTTLKTQDSNTPLQKESDAKSTLKTPDSNTLLPKGSDTKSTLKNTQSNTPLPKGNFSRKFPEHNNDYLPKLDVGKVKKCLKKVEYYLSYVENHGMIYE